MHKQITSDPQTTQWTNNFKRYSIHSDDIHSSQRKYDKYKKKYGQNTISDEEKVIPKHIENVILEPENFCNNCGVPATKMCNRCKNTFYCNRECQVSDWNLRHKDTCCSF
jgi:hypothetical protein